MESRKVTVSWYSDLESADKDRALQDASLTPNQRIEEVFRLMELVAGWQRHGRLNRTAQFIEFP